MKYKQHIHFFYLRWNYQYIYLKVFYIKVIVCFAEQKKFWAIFWPWGGGQIGPKSRFLKKKLLQIFRVSVSTSLKSCKISIIWIVNIYDSGQLGGSYRNRGQKKPLIMTIISYSTGPKQTGNFIIVVCYSNNFNSPGGFFFLATNHHHLTDRSHILKVFLRWSGNHRFFGYFSNFLTHRKK